ncbi:hypothetical protein [Vibrio gallicus]|uniref:hypothetical protein n=1 Tax=Vibrio gallicus TaxID=190897 RepID=UPI0021C26498|nr:hypothetical protein [Vibrio gallicus]
MSRLERIMKANDSDICDSIHKHGESTLVKPTVDLQDSGLCKDCESCYFEQRSSLVAWLDISETSPTGTTSQKTVPIK